MHSWRSDHDALGRGEDVLEGEAMSDQHLLRTPHRIRGVKNAWWYEEPQGICVVVEPAGNETRAITIKWRAITYAVKRKAKP